MFVNRVTRFDVFGLRGKEIVMKVTVAQLRTISELLYEHPENLGYAEIDLEYDYYWNIPKEDRYDVGKDLDLKRIDMGQLSDDWDSLREIAAGKLPPVSYAIRNLEANRRRSRRVSEYTGRLAHLIPVEEPRPRRFR